MCVCVRCGVCETCRPCVLTAAGLASVCRGDAPVRLISPMRPAGGAPRGGIWKGLWPPPSDQTCAHRSSCGQRVRSVLLPPAQTHGAHKVFFILGNGKAYENAWDFMPTLAISTIPSLTLSGTRRCPSRASAGRGGATSEPAVSMTTAASSASR